MPFLAQNDDFFHFFFYEKLWSGGRYLGAVRGGLLFQKNEPLRLFSLKERDDFGQIIITKPMRLRLLFYSVVVVLLFVSMDWVVATNQEIDGRSVLAKSFQDFQQAYKGNLTKKDHDAHSTSP